VTVSVEHRALGDGAGAWPLLESAEPAPSRMHSNLTLTLALALASFKLKYAGSVLGYLWSLVKPLLLFGMMYVVFALFLLRGRTPSGENFPVELLFGIVIWTFFADATSTSLLAIVNNGDMIKKAYFPRWILVVAAELSSLMTLVVNVALVLAVGIPLHWFTFGMQSLLLIPLLLELFVVAMGAGLLLSALYVYARDLAHIWEIILQALFFASAVVFPFTLIPDRFQGIVALSPLTQMIEDMRRAIISPGIPWTSAVLGARFAVPLVVALGSLGLGALIFARLSRRFGENI
jgi:ABC-2 type transport system permease protein